MVANLLPSLFRKRPHMVSLGFGRLVRISDGVWHDSWVIDLPFRLQLSRIPGGVIMTTRTEWNQRDRQLKVLMPVLWEAVRVCSIDPNLQLLSRVVDKAQSEIAQLRAGAGTGGGE